MSPDGNEQPGRAAVPPEVDVGAVDAVADGQPHGDPSVVGRDVGHGHVAVGDLVHDGAGVDAVAEDEVLEQAGCRDGEDRGDDDEGDDQTGDRHDPGLGAERQEDVGKHEGDDRHEEGSGEDRVPEARRHVVCGSEDDSDDHCDRVSEEDGGEVPAPEPVGDDLGDHRDGEEHRDEAEPVPGERGQEQEDTCDEGVDQDGLPRGILGIGCLDHPDEEVGHERDQERGERIGVAAGEDRRVDGERQEGEQQGCHDADPLVEHLLTDEVDGDACEGPDNGVDPGQGGGCGLGCAHAERGEHRGDACGQEVHERRIHGESADGVVDGRIREGVRTVQNAFDYVQMILCT